MISSLKSKYSSGMHAQNNASNNQNPDPGLHMAEAFHTSRDSNPPDLIGSLLIWCLASHSPDFYQILPIYYKILKTREKLLIFRIFGNLSLSNTHITLTIFAKGIMVCYGMMSKFRKWYLREPLRGACPWSLLEARTFGANNYSLFSITWGWNLCTSRRRGKDKFLAPQNQLLFL